MKPSRILLPIQHRDDMAGIADAAYVLAKRFGAEIEALHTFVPPAEQMQVYYEAAGPIFYDTVEGAEERSKAAMEEAKATFETFSKAHPGVPSWFASTDKGTVAGIAHRGRLADLTVIGKMPERGSSIWLDIRDAALFQTGRPVVVAPSGGLGPEPGGTVIVAWKDSLESARAMYAAMPFIETAATVRLVSAGEDAASKESLAEVKGYLELHAKSVEVEIIGADKTDAATLLLEDAARYPGAILVAGAYSQWRLKEWIFGGVTELLLRETRVPVLMAC